MQGQSEAALYQVISDQKLFFTVMNLFNTIYAQYRQYIKIVMILGTVPASKLHANRRWPLSRVSLAEEYSKGGPPQPANYVETDRGS